MKNEFDDDAPNLQAQNEPPLTASKAYEVGYGKPPKHTQFPHGNGPGKGKPKGAKNMKTIVNSATGAKVTTKSNGKFKKISKIEAAVHQLANKAAAGDLKAIEKLIALSDEFAIGADPSIPAHLDAGFDSNPVGDRWRQHFVAVRLALMAGQVPCRAC